MRMASHRSSALIGLVAICAATQGLSAPPSGDPIASREAIIASAKTVLQEGDDIPFDRAREAIGAIGYTRAEDAGSVRLLVGRLTCEERVPSVRYADGVRFAEEYRPTPYALARIGLPALPALLSVIASEGSSELQVARAEEAVKQMLQREATLWYEQAAAEAPAESGAARRLRAAAESLRDEPALPPTGKRMLFSLITWGHAGPPPDDLAAGIASPDEATRRAALDGLRHRRDADIRALAKLVGDPECARRERAEAATALGRMRAVAGGGSEGPALLALLAEERLRPGKPLTEAETPAALALVRIGVPEAPSMVETIAHGEAQLRTNCAGVLATMLGRYARAWLEAAANTADSEVAARRIRAELATWAGQFTGEGYWAEGGQ